MADVHFSCDGVAVLNRSFLPGCAPAKFWVASYVRTWNFFMVLLLEVVFRSKNSCITVVFCLLGSGE